MPGWPDTPQSSFFKLNFVPTLHPEAAFFFPGSPAHFGFNMWRLAPVQSFARLPNEGPGLGTEEP